MDYRELRSYCTRGTLYTLQQLDRLVSYNSVTHWLTDPPTHPLSHSLTNSLTHSLTHTPISLFLQDQRYFGAMVKSTLRKRTISNCPSLLCCPRWSVRESHFAWLCDFCVTGKIDVLKYLVGEVGVDPVAKDLSGMSTIHAASMGHQLEVVKVGHTHTHTHTHIHRHAP